ncbi:S8 family serine peptidase [Virgibacillus halodenitrificans]|uniref:S8 family serine peptidase n=1 Tax=Virgibacillus halodenitrificans TaxID=1482 RepID=UPI002DBDAA23|nr:S8 family serine peptidase [Virgibacillus halodenitrificans]MEC2158270.1 S8 family serine peptidase [Virgibacillus halodenitrificans]
MNVKRIIFLLFTGLVCMFWQPVSSYGAEASTKDVIIGYKDEVGKQLIVNQSKSIDNHFKSLSAFAVSINASDVEKYKGNEHITYIEENVPVTLSNSSNSINEIKNGDTLVEGETWNLRSSRFSYAWEEGATGKDVKVAVIDTGISPHKDLKVAGGVSTVDYTEKWEDDNGHGTHVAGIIGAEQNGFGVVGVAPDASIYAVKALDSHGEGDMNALLKAIEWSIQHEMDVINLSLGTEFHSDALEKIIKQAYDAGILIVGASGNGEGDGKVIYPAKYEQVIAVSALDEQFHSAPFASSGPEVEFSAPGTNIISTYLNGNYGIASGTSQASPHITGMLALLQQKLPDKNPEERRAALTDYVQDLGETGRDSYFGFGRISYITDFTAPDEIADLKLHKTESEAFSIQWINPENEDFDKTIIYLNDSMVKEKAKGEETSYTFTELEANTPYDIAIYTEDIYGNRSKGVIQTVTTKKSGLIISEKQKESEEDQESDPKPESPVKEEKKEEENKQEQQPEKDVTPPVDEGKKDEEKQPSISIPAPVQEPPVSNEQSEHKNPAQVSENNEKQKEAKQEDSLAASGSTNKAEEVEEKESQSEQRDVSKDSNKNEQSTAAAIDEGNKDEDNDENLFMQFFSWIGGLFRSIFQSLVQVF